MKLKTIVADTNDFPTLVRGGNVYVDKAASLDVPLIVEFRGALKTGGYYAL